MTQAVFYLNALRAFEAAARHESIAKAAAELHVSHSVVSKHIRNLEAWLQTSLFIRHGNRIELTDEARQFSSRISEAFQIIRDTCENYRGHNGIQPLIVRAEPAFSTRWLRRKLAEFQRAQPHVEVSLRSDAGRPNLKDGSTDVAIHFESLLINEGMLQDRLFPIDGFPSCSPDFYQKNKKEIKNQDFFKLPLIHDNGRTVWQQWFHTHAPETDSWESGKVYSDLLLAMDAAIDGEGIFLADNVICAKEMKTGALIKLDDRILRCTWYTAAYNESTPTNPAISLFREWINDATASCRGN